MNEVERFQALCDQGRFLEAVPIIEALIESAPHISTSWFNYGIVLNSLGRTLDSAEAFLKSANLDPQKRGLYSACRALAQTQAADRLAEVFEAELRENPLLLEKFVAGEFARFWDLPAFSQLNAKYRGRGNQ